MSRYDHFSILHLWKIHNQLQPDMMGSHQLEFYVVLIVESILPHLVALFMLRDEWLPCVMTFMLLL